MDSDTAQTPFERIIESLDAEGVEFIVIGGQAEALYGSARVTFDTDLCYRRTAENLERLAEARGIAQAKACGSLFYGRDDCLA